MGTESVQEWMTVDPVTIGPSSSLGAARAQMQRSDVSRLLVVEENGKLVGIITLGDVAGAWPSPFTPLEPFEVRELMARVVVEEVMTSPVVSVDSETTVAEAASLMFERRVGALPVVDEGRVVGILTCTDVLQGLVRILTREENASTT
jgi:acetoin utilization protein AcuB